MSPARRLLTFTGAGLALALGVDYMLTGIRLLQSIDAADKHARWKREDDGRRAAVRAAVRAQFDADPRPPAPDDASPETPA